MTRPKTGCVSSLASGCLPEAVRRQIAKTRRLGLAAPDVGKRSLTCYRTQRRMCLSVPMDFAEYFGAPGVKRCGKADFLVQPCPVESFCEERRTQNMVGKPS